MAARRVEDTMDGEDWQSRANCRDADIELFFSIDEADQREALQLCAACPVQQPCLRHAIATGETYGIWGGTREGERRALIRDRRRLRRRTHAA